MIFKCLIFIIKNILFIQINNFLITSNRTSNIFTLQFTMSSDKVKCEYCEKEYTTRGLTSHKKKCSRKPADDSADTIISNVNTSNIPESENNVKSKVVVKKVIKSAKKIKEIIDNSYLKLPFKDQIFKYENNKHNEENEKLEKIHSRIKSIHNILWGTEKMEAEDALDEVMSLLFLIYISQIITDDPSEPNKIDILNKTKNKYYIDEIAQYGDEDSIKNFELGSKYLKNFNQLYLDYKKAIESADNSITFRCQTEELDIFKIITKILKGYDDTANICDSNKCIISSKYDKSLLASLSILQGEEFDNSNQIEDLIGEIYEYFINKYMKKKSKLGQYFTPRGLMNITLKYLEPRIKGLYTLKTQYSPDTDFIVSDKCMGTGGWLVKFYNDFNKDIPNIKLHGCELHSNTYKYGLINLISTLCKAPYMPHCGNSLAEIKNIQLNAIMSNPPFNAKLDYDILKADYEQFKADKLKNGDNSWNVAKFEDIYFLKGENNTPLQFLQLYIHCLAKGGLCAIVLPYGELFYGDGKMARARCEIMKRVAITDVIVCPAGIFTHTDIKVCVLVFEKPFDGSGTKQVKFSKLQFNNDGNTLESVRHLTTVSIDDINMESAKSLYHGDYLIDENSYDLKQTLNKYEWVPFGKLFDLIQGSLQSSKVIEAEDLNNGITFVTGAKPDSWKYIIKEKESYIDGENIFISGNGNGNCRPIRYFNGECNYSDLMCLIVHKNDKYKINKKYIYHYLTSIQKYIENTYQKGSCNQGLDVKNFSRMEIPIPSIEIQNEIIKRLDNSQTKITYAYKAVDVMETVDKELIFKYGLEGKLKEPTTQFVPFGDLFDLVPGSLQSSKVEEDPDGDILFVSKSEFSESDRYIKTDSFYENGGLFIAKAGNGEGRKEMFPIRYTEKKCIHSDLMYYAETTNNMFIINKKYIYYYLTSIQKHIGNTYVKGSCNPSLDVKNFSRMEIPIPSIESQNHLVSQIESVDKIIAQWNKDIDFIKTIGDSNINTSLSDLHKK